MPSPKKIRTIPPCCRAAADSPVVGDTETVAAPPRGAALREAECDSDRAARGWPVARADDAEDEFAFPLGSDERDGSAEASGIAAIAAPIPIRKAIVATQPAYRPCFATEERVGTVRSA